MQAAIYTEFQGAINIEKVPDPTPSVEGVVLEVGATGICRSDWHGWMGNDPDIVLPHVPGHELAGTIVEVGKNVESWKTGDRVTLPFVCGCGNCQPCEEGNPQVCDQQFQPGFTHWGSFAEYVAIDYAEQNLVQLPENLSFTEAASLGCRFITAFRALVDQGKLRAEQSISIFGCGGVGLSAILIARAIGARIIAVDIDPVKLELAKRLGAEICLNSTQMSNVSEAILDLTGGGCHVSLDALGSSKTALQSIRSLRKTGKHIQVGIMSKDDSFPGLPIDIIIARELEIIGSHGMPAYRFEAVFDLISNGKLDLKQMIEKEVDLEKGVEILRNMASYPLSHGIAVINSFN